MKYFQFLLLVVFVFWIGGCAIDQGDREAMVQTHIAKKFKEVKSSKLRNCHDEIVRLATLQVDSMLIEKSRLEKDLMEKPAIPSKPSEPELKKPFDDSEVKPIID